MNTKNKEPEQGDIEPLLPWHAVGTLSRRDTQRVEEALASDPELARRYAMVREELGETILLNETLGAPSGHAMEKLFAKIDAEPARKQAMSLNLGARVAGFFVSLSPRTLAWSASAAAIAILLQAGLIASIVIKEHSAGG
jgi:anti-sigma factor RsiW